MKRLPMFALISLFTIVLMGLNTHSVNAQEKLILNTTVSEPLSNTQGVGVTDLLLREAFKRANINMEITYVPAERALLNANKGFDDGTFLRISGMEKNYVNLVAVPESVLTFDFVAISKNSKIKPISWDSIKPFSVGIITGWKIAEENTTKVAMLTKVSLPGQLFQLLKLNRTDLIIYEKLRAQVALQRTPILSAKILTPPLAKRSMFLYLNKKHQPLIDRIAVALRAMKKDGTHERLIAQGLAYYK